MWFLCYISYNSVKFYVQVKEDPDKKPLINTGVKKEEPLEDEKDKKNFLVNGGTSPIKNENSEENQSESGLEDMPLNGEVKMEDDQMVKIFFY